MHASLIGPLRTAKHALTRSYSRFLRNVAGVRYTQFVVCGYPRSGTSLLYNMLSATLVGFRFADFELSALRRIHRLGNIASKYPLDVFDVPSLPSLNLHDKRLCVVGMVRDPRDLVTSRHPVLPDRYFIGYDHSWWPQDRQFENWKYDAPGILEIFEALRGLGDQTEIPFLQVRYERLVQEPNAIQDQLATRFGVEFSGSFADFHQQQGKLAYRYSGRRRARDEALVRENKPADASRAGKWRASEHADQIREQFRSCPELFEIVRAYGYESDDDWFEPYDR